MTLERLTVRGFMTAFAGKEVSINFADMPDGLVAVVGGNGEGKTTLLEGAPAGLYRQMMSRDGDLKTYAQDRDSAIEQTWKVGERFYQTRLTVDGIKGGASAALFESTDRGVTPLNDGKVSTYDTAIAKVFPPVHVFKASAFAAQNKSGSFVRASKKDRRDIFNAFLNLDRLVAMSEVAKEAAAEVDKVRVSVRYEIQNLELAAGAETANELLAQIRGLEQQGADALRRRDELALLIGDAELRLAVLSDQVAAAAAAQQRVDALSRDLQQRRRDLSAHAEKHEAASVAEGAEAERLRKGRELALGLLDAKLQSTAEAAEITALERDVTAKLTEIDAKLAGNKQIQDMADEIRAAVLTITEAGAELEQLRAELEVLRARERDLARQQSANEASIAAFTKPQAALERATKDAGLLEHVPCGGQGEYASCQLLVDATAAKAQIGQLQALLADLGDVLRQREVLAGEITRTATAIDRGVAQVAGVEKRLQAAQTKAAYADKLAASEARVVELKGQWAFITSDHQRQLEALRARYATVRDELAQDRTRLVDDWNGRERVMVERHAARASECLTLGAALSADVQRLETEHAAARIELEDVTSSSRAAAAIQGEIGQLRSERDAAVTAIATASSDAATVRKRIEDLQTKTARIVVLRARVTTLDTELIEWQLLQKALDRDGLPALETDQAGPEISALTNQILADCFDSRFSVELVTQVSRADGKGMKDEFTLLVTDNHTGQIRDIADLSGGEEVIVAEAFMNAISLFINARSSAPMRTWFRDETTGALTKENTQRYVRMLRKVQAMGDVRQIVFISHDPDAYALADAQIRVAGGAVSTMVPPYMAA